MTDIEIRPARADDRATLLGFLVAIQDYERALDPNLRLGAEAAESALVEIERKMAAHNGALLRAVLSGKAIGFVSCHDGDDEDKNLQEKYRPYGYVSNVFVAADHRRTMAASRLPDTQTGGPGCCAGGGFIAALFRWKCRPS